MSIRAWMSTETMEKGTFACLAMFALVSSCSVALGNIFLGHKG